MIPKAGGKTRRLGIPTVRDRVVQAAVKLVLEPIFEADFEPCSYGFRPNRRAHDAVAEVRHFCSRSYEWVLEADIEACFDNIDHSAPDGSGAPTSRRQARVGPGQGVPEGRPPRGGPAAQGHEHRHPARRHPLAAAWQHRPVGARRALRVGRQAMGSDPGQRQRRRQRGLATYRLVHYADDFVVVVSGTREHTETLHEEVAAVLAPMGLRLSEDKTRLVHIDEGFDFLGWRIQRQQQQGGVKRFVYTFPAKTSLMRVKAKVRTLTQELNTGLPLAAALHQLNRVLRGWTNYFRFGVSSATFSYLRAFTWRRVVNWLRRKHPRANWMQLRRRYLPGWWPTDSGAGVMLFNPAAVATVRYRYRGARIPLPWTSKTEV